MSYIPPDFAKRLQREFDGRLRIRWSDQREAFQIEMQAGRRNWNLPLYRDRIDATTRARDGYVLVMEVQPKPTLKCPKRVSQDPDAQRCGVKLDLPARQFVEVTCLNCRAHGRMGRTRAEYWPLDDQLLDRLKQMDPKRQWAYRTAAEVDLANQRQRLSDEAEAFGIIDAANYDYRKRMADIQQVGYTGRSWR